MAKKPKMEKMAPDKMGEDMSGGMGEGMGGVQYATITTDTTGINEGDTVEIKGVVTSVQDGTMEVDVQEVSSEQSGSEVPEMNDEQMIDEGLAESEEMVAGE